MVVNSVKGAVFHHACLVVIEGNRGLVLIETAFLIVDTYHHASLLLGNLEDVVERLGVLLFVGNGGELAGTVQIFVERLVTDAQDKSLDNYAAHLYLTRHLANVSVAVVDAVGDDKDDVA